MVWCPRAKGRHEGFILRGINNMAGYQAWIIEVSSHVSSRVGGRGRQETCKGVEHFDNLLGYGRDKGILFVSYNL